ncbi:hypothetical protein ILYODFUR_003398 [Ilyodon furcidens]|uniref:Uncharacterized protein n=1 Tax=Ilyodon furcidens TaxID=33524 RepID=A0ABV0T517_9TELE
MQTSRQHDDSCCLLASFGISQHSFCDGVIPYGSGNHPRFIKGPTISHYIDRAQAATEITLFYKNSEAGWPCVSALCFVFLTAHYG